MEIVSAINESIRGRANAHAWLIRLKLLDGREHAQFGDILKNNDGIDGGQIDKTENDINF